MRYVIERKGKYLQITDRTTGTHEFGPIYAASPFFHLPTVNQAARAVNGTVVSYAEATKGGRSHGQ